MAAFRPGKLPQCKTLHLGAGPGGCVRRHVFAAGVLPWARSMAPQLPFHLPGMLHVTYDATLERPGQK